MNPTNRRRRQNPAYLALPTLLVLTALTVLPAGCGGSKQAVAPLPTFANIYTFGTSHDESLVTVLPDGTAYGITYRDASPTTFIGELTRYTDFGRGTATVIVSPVYPADESYAVAVSPVNGNIYVAVSSTLAVINPPDTIGVFSPTGQSVLTFINPAPVPAIRGRDRIVIDSKGFVYILGQNASQASFVYKCDPSGNLLKAIDVSAVTYGSDALMAIDAADRLYFIETGDTETRISELTTDGVVVKQFRADVGRHVTGIGVDGVGNIYVSNSMQYGEPYGMFRLSPEGVLTAESDGGLPFTVDTFGTVYTDGGAIEVLRVTP